jgi:hypothetical protein
MLQDPLTQQRSSAQGIGRRLPQAHVACCRYASEVSGFSAYSTAAGPYHGRYRGAPSVAGNEFDTAFEQGYHYAGVQNSALPRLTT